MFNCKKTVLFSLFLFFICVMPQRIVASHVIHNHYYSGGTGKSSGWVSGRNVLVLGAVAGIGAGCWYYRQEIDEKLKKTLGAGGAGQDSLASLVGSNAGLNSSTNSSPSSPKKKETGGKKVVSELAEKERSQRAAMETAFYNATNSVNSSQGQLIFLQGLLDSNDKVFLEGVKSLKTSQKNLTLDVSTFCQFSRDQNRQLQEATEGLNGLCYGTQKLSGQFEGFKKARESEENDFSQVLNRLGNDIRGLSRSTESLSRSAQGLGGAVEAVGLKVEEMQEMMPSGDTRSILQGEKLDIQALRKEKEEIYKEQKSLQQERVSVEKENEEKLAVLKKEYENLCEYHEHTKRLAYKYSNM